MSLLTDKVAAPVVDGQAPQSTPQGGQDGKSAQPQQEAQPQTQNNAGKPAAAWLAQVKPDLQNHVDLSGFRTVDEAARAYVELKGKLANSVRLPGKDATEEELAAFRKAMGIPETSDKYQLPEIKLPNGLTVKGDALEDYRKVCHKHNLTQAQAEGIIAWYSEELKNVLEAREESYKADRALAEKSLRNEWGDAYNEKFILIERALKQFGSPELITILDKTGLGDSPEIIKFLAQVAEATVREARSVNPGIRGGGAQAKSDEELFYGEKKR